MIRSKIASRFKRAITMGFLWALLALLLHVVPGPVGPAHAQGTRKDDIVFNSRGIPLAGATVRVCAMPATGQPCTPLALIYSDAALTQALANPTTTDGLGNYFFYAAPGKYEIEISGPGITTKQIPNVILPNDPASPNFSAISAFSLSLSGNLTVSGNTTVIGNLASGTLNVTNQSTPPGAPSAGTVNLYTKTADRRLYYKDDSGTEIGPLGPGNGAQTNVTNTFTASQNFDADVHTKGPNPYVDLSRYGVRGGNASTTVNCTSGQNQVTLGAASTFQNGDGVTLFGCGAPVTNTMPSGPGAPTVTPSVAKVLTGTGYVVNAPTGATTYNYKIIARDIAGGYTAASTAGSTSTGSASLGQQSVSLTSCSRSNATVTCVTSSAHGLSVGSMIILSGQSDTSFNGWYPVATVPDNTHFTFTSGQTTTNGATTSATGGTVVWFNCNHVTWSAVTGAFEYYVYSDRAVPGTFALIGVSKPVNGSFTFGTLFLDDFGSPMMDNFTAKPANIPTTAPTVASNDNLTTTIVSGAGTTTLTLAANAGTTISGVNITYDDAPNVKTAEAAAGGAPIYAPFGVAVTINSVLNLTGPPTPAIAGGAWTLNDTVLLRDGTRWQGNVYPSVGSAGAFSFQSYGSSISCNASPCILVVSGGGPAFSYLNFNSNTNGQTMMMVDGGGGSPMGTYEYLYFGGALAGDYMNVNLLLRGAGNPGGHFKGVNFNGHQGTFGSTATPTFWTQGGFVFDKVFFSGRGALAEADPSGDTDVVNWLYSQGNITPLFTMAGDGSGGNAGVSLLLKDVSVDTSPAPVVTYLPSVGTVTLSVQLNAVGAGANVPQITGNALLAVTGNLSGQNTAAINGASNTNFTDNLLQVTGTGAMGYIIQPVAPASAVVSAGGGVPVATHAYTISIIDASGHEGQIGPAVNATTTSGNQTVTVTPPAAPAGGVQYSVYRDGGGVHQCANLNFTQTCVDTFGFVDTASPRGTVSYASGLTSSGVETQALLVAGSFKDTISGIFTANRAQTLPDVNGIVPVSSYQNSAYDNFNRANGALGSNWTSAIGTLQVSNNTAIATVLSGGDASAIWANGSSFAANQFAQSTITFLNGTTDFLGPSVRYSTAGNGYACIEDTTTLVLQRHDSNTRTNLQTATITGTNGDVLRIEANGSTITCTQASASGAVVSVSSTDSTYPTGSPGIFQFGNVATQDNWSGGNLHPLAHLDAEQDWTRPQHFTQGLALGTETLSASPRAEQSVFLPGALTSTWTGSTWTLDKAISVTRVQVQVKTAPAGCTTNASVRLTDGTSPVSLTVSAAANDSGPITQNYAAGASLTIGVQTAAAGCTTSPADANVVVQYRMQ